ncbi:NAD(P)-binding Rossmann-fold superfamily protein [Rhynchospora pubera]|uniref:NAD(P)-binding Rossmann-fold superfamily protein n=1 Tax=Rhynchospora pubera TaxID=906938 RepID=A0AAV8ASE4_9POAL|nr:NAD(P)-binding Rossmann-fold superfamily protein [Rhynchospora pubera]KAJ4791225.1 NAD(P)-binding Rossmann-fold superfamily protein [Rhynchospora pubera]
MSRIALKLNGTKLALDALAKLHTNRQHHKLFSTNSQSGRLAGKIALITGAASGIGKAAAIRFIETGAKVLLADVQDHLGKSIANDLGPNATYIHCNVTNEQEISSAVDHAVAQYGRLDVMYNNAGIIGEFQPTILDLELEGFDWTMAVNVRSTVAGIKHASRVMIPRQAGSIICTASTTAILGGMANHDYAVSKAAVIGLVKSTAAELNQHGIRVNCIAPHALPTPLSVNFFKNRLGIDDEKMVVEMTHNMWEFKGARCGAADIAEAALFLASDDAKYISGHNLVVDAGFTCFKRLNFSP